jgi:hypothetical protein
MVLVQVMSWVPSAQAAGKESKERAARKACLSGDYAKGVGILSDLFIETEDANYIFNQARCFEQNSRCEEAIGRFREFLRKATAITPADRADTEKHIADCQALLGQKIAPAPTSDSAVAVAPKTEAAPPAPAAPPAALNPPPAPTSPPPAAASLLPARPSPPPAAASPLPAETQTPPAAGTSSSAAPPPPEPVAIPVPPPVPQPLDTTTNLASAPVAPAESSAEQPIYKKWWFWTGVGAVVVAGTVTAIMLTRQSSNPCGVTSLTCWEIK